MRRTYSFDPNGKRHLSMPTLPARRRSPKCLRTRSRTQALRRLHAPAVARVVDAPVDVIVSLLPTDDENIAIVRSSTTWGRCCWHCTSTSGRHRRCCYRSGTRRNTRATRAHRRRRAARPAFVVRWRAPCRRSSARNYPAAHWSGSLEGGPCPTPSAPPAPATMSRRGCCRPAARQGVGRPVVRDAGQDAGQGGGRPGRPARGDAEVAARARPAAGAVAVRARRHPFHPAHEPALALGGAPPPAPDLL